MDACWRVSDDRGPQMAEDCSNSAQTSARISTTQVSALRFPNVRARVPYSPPPLMRIFDVGHARGNSNASVCTTKFHRGGRRFPGCSHIR